MHRFYLPPKEWNSATPALDEGECHHVLDVLRFGVGDHVTVFDGEGAEARAQITIVEGKRIELRIGQKIRSQPLACAITLAQAVPKGKHMDFIVQKATELGATRIAPLFSDRTVVQLDASDAEKKREKWREIAIEACKQCGQNRIPEIAAPSKPKAFFEKQEQSEIMLIASLAARRTPDQESAGRLPAAPQCLRTRRSRGRFHACGARPGKEQWLPADYARSNHSAGGDRRALLPKRFGARVVLISPVDVLVHASLPSEQDGETMAGRGTEKDRSTIVRSKDFRESSEQFCRA